jgi:rubrerythrin
MFVFGTADDVFAMAVRIEENGHAFYSGAAEIAQDPTTKKLFEGLAEMESHHVVFFKSLRSRLESAQSYVWDPEGLAETYLQHTAETHVFTPGTETDRLKDVKTPIDALDMALKFEKDSVSFFVGMKEILPDATGKNDVDALVRAEMEHISMLSHVKRQLLEGKKPSIL